MTQEVQVKESSEVGFNIDDFGSGDITSQDIVIPKVLTMQGLSKLVTDGVAKFGDFIDSISSEVIGNYEKKPVEFIPFHMEKQWIVSKKVGDKFNYVKTEPCTPVNENRQWEEIIDGVVYKNERQLSFYCILPSDPSIPYIIQFKGTSAKAGKELATQMYIKNRAVGKVPPAKVMVLKGEKTQNDKGIFVKMKTAVVRDSTPNEIKTCLEWFQVIKKGNVKVDDSDTESEMHNSPASEESQF